LEFKASERFGGFGADLGFWVGEGLAEGVEDELLLFEVLKHGRLLGYWGVSGGWDGWGWLWVVCWVPY
jgi:hypothetical protein